MSRYEADLSFDPTLCPRQEPGWGGRLAAAGQTLLGRLLAWRERARSRHQLAGMDDRLLRDIGVDRATAHAESDKGFWQG